MRFDPTIKKKMVEKYPELRNAPELNNCKDEYIRYAIYLIDEESPLYGITDYKVKAEKALELAGIKKSKQSKDDIVNMRNSEVNKVISIMFIIYNDLLYETWFSMKIAYHQISNMLRKGIDKKGRIDPLKQAEIKMKLSEKLDELGNKVRNYESQIFTDKEIVKVVSQYSTQMINWAEEFADEDTVV